MRRLVPVLGALALLLAACGGGDSSGTTTAGASSESESSDTEPSTDSTEAPSGESDSSGGGDSGLPPGGTGTVTIDGETIQSDWVGNCLIDDLFDPHPDDLDLVVAMDGGSNALFIEIGFEELSDGLLMRFMPELQRQDDGGSYVNYQPEGQYMLAPDGNWYQDTDGALYVAIFSGQPHESEPVDAPVSLSSGNVSGSMPLFSESGDSVEVAFNLDYTEAVDCSL